MAVVFQESKSYGRSTSFLLKNLSPWEGEIWKKAGKMYFYKGDATKLVNIEIMKNPISFVVTTFSFNSIDTSEFYSKTTEPLLADLASKLPKGVSQFVYDYDRQQRVVSTDFIYASYRGEESCVAYIFENCLDGELEFPTIFISTFSSKDSVNRVHIAVQSCASHDVAAPENATLFGKKFIYILAFGELSTDKFTTETPYLQNVELPTNRALILPSSIKSKEFIAFCEGVASDSLIRTSKAVVVRKLEAPKDDGIETVEGREILSLEDFPNIDMANRNRIARQLLMSDTVNLSDVIEHGLENILKMMPPLQFPDGVDVILDTGNIFREAMILDGFLYGIPIDPENFDWSLAFGNGEELFNPVDAPTFKIMKNAKNLGQKGELN